MSDKAIAVSDLSLFFIFTLKKNILNLNKYLFE